MPEITISPLASPRGFLNVSGADAGDIFVAAARIDRTRFRATGGAGANGETGQTEDRDAMATAQDLAVGGPHSAAAMEATAARSPYWSGLRTVFPIPTSPAATAASPAASDWVVPKATNLPAGTGSNGNPGTDGAEGAAVIRVTARDAAASARMFSGPGAHPGVATDVPAPVGIAPRIERRCLVAEHGTAAPWPMHYISTEATLPVFQQVDAGIGRDELAHQAAGAVWALVVHDEEGRWDPGTARQGAAAAA